jgi:hypothetical protein
MRVLQVVRGLPDVGGSAGGGVLLHECNQQQLMLAAAGHKIGSSIINPAVSSIQPSDNVLIHACLFS